MPPSVTPPPLVRRGGTTVASFFFRCWGAAVRGGTTVVSTGHARRSWRPGRTAAAVHAATIITTLWRCPPVARNAIVAGASYGATWGWLVSSMCPFIFCPALAVITFTAVTAAVAATATSRGGRR